MNLYRYLTQQSGRDVERAVNPPISFDQWASFFGFNGIDYAITGQGGTLAAAGGETIANSFPGYVEGAYKSNGIVFACIAARMLIFSEARFRYQRLRGGRPGDLYGTPELDVLERPWPGGTTGDLLSRMLLDADLGGNWFCRVRAGRNGDRVLERLRPDWVTIVAGGDSPSTATRAGYIYQPGGAGSSEDPVALLPEEVAHFAPYPDPIAQFRGMSWLTPVVREITADSISTDHKLRYFEQGATPNTVVTLGDVDLTPEAFNSWVDVMESTHAGAANAYRTWYLGAGADAKVVGNSLQQIDFKAVQGAGETRIAAAARVPAVIVGISEGLQGSSLNAGNYNASKRAFTDGTIRPLWRNAAGSLAPLVATPRDARLWYDDRDIPYLQEDRKDAAEIQNLQAQTIRTLTDAGYEPDSVLEAVQTEDWERLVGAHAGLFSVQLQEPGGGQQNGNGNGSAPALPAGATEDT